jgi:hypothetical protein
MESLPQKQNLLYCRDCGAEISSQAVRCWCCQQSFLEASGGRTECIAAEAIDQRADQVQRRTRYFLGLASALLLATIAEVVFFGIFVKRPGLGTAIAILLTPALIRVVVMAMQTRPRETPSSVWIKVFIVHLWIFLGGAVLVAAIITFLMTCNFRIN